MVYQRNRGKGRGGLLVYVKQNIKCELITWPTEIDIECNGLNIILPPEKSFIFITLCRPSAKYLFYDQLKMILNHCNFKREMTLMGDFNTNWTNKTNNLQIILAFLANYLERSQLDYTKSKISM